MNNIEICEVFDGKEKVAGRTYIKMSALKISENDNDNNGNGINWDKQFVQNNIQSMIGASYKVCFVDDDKTIPSGHGDMEYDENGNIAFPNSDSVGSIQKAYLQDINLEGKQQTILCTEGYIYSQSYPNFVNWLKSESNQGTVYGSVEINGKGDSKRIVYSNGTGVNSDGSPQIGRKPQVFDFTALAILSSIVEPADQSSRVFEVNSKIQTEQVQINNNESEVNKNASFINNQSKKEEVNSMDDKVVLELNQKVEDKTKENNELNNKNTELNAKNAELSEAVTNANKTCEEVNAKVESLTEELNACKTELEALKKEKADAEDVKKKAEVNSYFETEIPKNKFADEEINSLKPFVDAIDLDGLKNAEAEICAKKFKEMISKTEPDVEINAKHSFIPIHESEKKIISDKVHSFFNV